ncbi:Hypothetical predicted protein [Podarcis lilfordi]|uniref:Uncharacterized protein n=1 Tax=Podarcis lilfordi TaxID=74358 RepID=A0AA35KB61_9SAUR|nr:Hypothetical predicted protein [Podarcis lilfordi]
MRSLVSKRVEREESELGVAFLPGSRSRVAEERVRVRDCSWERASEGEKRSAAGLGWWLEAGGGEEIGIRRLIALPRPHRGSGNTEGGGEDEDAGSVSGRAKLAPNAHWIRSLFILFYPKHEGGCAVFTVLES